MDAYDDARAETAEFIRQSRLLQKHAQSLRADHQVLSDELLFIEARIEAAQADCNAAVSLFMRDALQDNERAMSQAAPCTDSPPPCNDSPDSALLAPDA